MKIESKYQPKSRIERWLEARLPIVRFAHDTAVSYPVPRNLNYFWTFGGVLTFMLASQIVTGITLAMHYVPSGSLAFVSVEKIMRDVNSGWLIRYLHANGASMFFIAVYIHIFRGLYYGSYKAPRELLWILGMINFLLLMAIAFMGYVLPWGQMSFWGTTVITNLFSVVPYVGDWLVELLWGGYAVGDPTLNRFFSLHYLLPFMLVGVVVLHIWALHHVGQNNPTGVEVQDIETETVPFTPDATVKDLFGLSCFLIFFACFVFYIPNFLGHTDNYIPADPGSTPHHIVPEWYFLPFYAILRAIPHKLGGALAMGSAVLALAFLPWIDTSRVRSMRYRPVGRLIFWMFAVSCVSLGYLGAQPAEGGYIIAARIFTALYFLYFPGLFLAGLFETPLPRPASIAQSVLEAKSKMQATAGRHNHPPQTG
ncbi:ubiquinol-cytochrome c reductase cytochrome b subunit [Rhizobium azooxidifex]|uniref:Cytochrome b n=1 Tax=Mycoplana azooxidifex TaxID=1636188 RepID=A0A7W6GLA7_9HYPH|nr:cytochrome b N-terminal domain-containing protein [Mycoplana azooxidifex]MBB3979505.1 ubiquinol-cytochrome c reductase cytochrome b subunit [Mycoplana azooxidifex]